MQQFNFFKNTYLFIILPLFLVYSCKSNSQKTIEISKIKADQEKKIIPGAYQLKKYLPLLQDKNIAIVGNQTSEINRTHLVDTLLALNIKIKKVFAPEHGFRGKASAGEHVKNSIDIKTGLPIISLYGKHKKPTAEDLKDIQIIVFDIQDVGARFYTYLSTLHYVMEAAAENNIPIIVLDRPNPNSDYIDGPVLEKEVSSFVGLHPVPIVYAMTIGEYAKMINGEGWLKNGIKAKLSIFPISNYKHGMIYKLPIKPSPNLPNYQAVRLYPSLCLLEGTDISVGRGTDWPFQIYGSPVLSKDKYKFTFTPHKNDASKWPKHENKLCYGTDLRNITPLKAIYLDWLIQTYKDYPDKNIFFRKSFNRLAGNITLQEMIKQGKSVADIKKTWQKPLNEFKKIRKKYLIYPDFTTSP